MAGDGLLCIGNGDFRRIVKNRLCPGMRKSKCVERCVLGGLIDQLTRGAGIDYGAPSLVLAVNPEFGSGTGDVDVVNPVGSHPLSARLQAQRPKTLVFCKGQQGRTSPDSKERQVYL